MMLGELIDTMTNIEYGLLIAIFVDILLLFVVILFNGSNKLTVLSYVISAILLIPLTFQMSRLIGAIQISNSASSLNEIIGIVSPTLNKYVSSATNQEMGWFIFRRIAWSLLFIGIACSGILVTMDKKQKRIHRVSERRPVGRRYSSTTSRRRR